MKLFAILFVFTLSSLASAKLVLHHVTNDVNNAGEAYSVIRSEVNMYIQKWYYGDVVVIYNTAEPQAVVYRMGTWVPATPQERAEAREGGIINTENMTCNDKNINSVITLPQPQSMSKYSAENDVLTFNDGSFYSTQSEPSFCRDPGDGSPLVIDMAQNGIKTGRKNRLVKFDIYGTGEEKQLQWLSKNTDDIFLAIDLNGNGEIDSGKELLGVGVDLKLVKRKASNGFEALAEYDDPRLGGNGDGVINASDEIWASLLLWNDKNANAKTENGELKHLKDSSLVSLDYSYTYYDVWDSNGNSIPYWSSAYNSAGEFFDLVDIFFHVKK